VTSEEPQATTRPGSDHPDLLLPAGTCLLHIGPPKTATTALQGAFFTARDKAEAQGVHYAGKTRHSAAAVLAGIGRPGFFSDDAAPATERWQQLVSEIRSSPASRVVLSSEFFADADPEHIASVTRSVARPNVHVVITLRPLVKIVPSHWQQSVQSSSRMAFDDWLHAMLDPDGDRSVNPAFWFRHRHDELVARWVSVVGQDNVTVVALDDKDHGMVLRTFEQLTGLTEGTIAPVDDFTNRSLTLPEVEALRAFNAELTAADVRVSMQRRVSHAGAAHYLKQFPPTTGDPKVEVPGWARPQINAVARDMIDRLVASGVRIVGDPEHLVPASPPGADDYVPEPVHVRPEVAARMAMGVLHATGATPWAATGTPAPAVDPLLAATLPTIELEKALARRARNALRRGWRTAKATARGTRTRD
jgi:hypothetical protein